MRDSHARTSSSVAGRTAASCIGVPSPSRTVPLSARIADHHLGAYAGGRVRVTGQIELGALALIEFEREDLAKPLAPVVLEHDVAAESQVEPVK